MNTRPSPSEKGLGLDSFSRADAEASDPTAERR